MLWDAFFEAVDGSYVVPNYRGDAQESLLLMLDGTENTFASLGIRSSLLQDLAVLLPSSTLTFNRP